MSLTLVELAQAIEQGKTIQESMKGSWFDTYETRDIVNLFMQYPDSVRIKPEPKEYRVYDLSISGQVVKVIFDDDGRAPKFPPSWSGAISTRGEIVKEVL